MAMMPELPKEIVEEILCRVPATHLKRLRSTCKWWYRLFNDKRFARKHSEKAPKQFLAFVLKTDYIVRSLNVNLRGITVHIERNFCRCKSCNPHGDNSTLKFDVSPFDRVFHCDGLLLCTSFFKSCIVVWNPLTGQTKWIEARDDGETFLRECYYLLGYYYQDNKSSYTKSYKILGFKSGVKGSKMYEFDSGSWRISLDDIAPGWYIDDYSSQVSLEGKAYLFARDKTKMQTGVCLVRFDFSTEKFAPVLLPYQCDSYKTKAISVFRGEKLSLILHREDASDTEVWVTNKIDETQVVSWTKVLALKLDLDLQIWSLASFLLDEEKKVVAWYHKWESGEEDRDEYDYGESYNEKVIKKHYIHCWGGQHSPRRVLGR